jgi:tetratricopeptide (TPR) repeat protein
MALALLVSAAPAIGGPVDDARAAYARGSYQEALRILRVEADRGSAEAQFILGLIYQAGKGVPQDDIQAAQWYRKAADQKFAQAEVALGSLYVTGGVGVPAKPAEATQLFLSAAQAGNADGQLNVGISYEQGFGIAQSYPEALNWYRLAAAQGNDDAALNLGYLYHEGLGTAKDNDTAARWYRVAADRGSNMAQLNLGLMHMDREVSPADPVEGMMWLILASESQPKASDYIEALSKRMTPDQVFEAQRRAQAWKPKPPAQKQN